MEIRSLADTDFDTLYEAFSQAFADYEVQINGTQLRRMLKRRGFDARLSFAAFDGDRIAAFTLNGIGNYDGLPTAYDTGTGTLEAYRGQGLATRIFEHSIPYLKEAGIGRYLLGKSVDVVCIATSDKGYTDTVKELRRQGKKVVGIGEKKAPKELRDACSEFFEIK